MMTVEARELYLYATGTEPFASMTRKAKTLAETWKAVRAAEKQYIKDYCTAGKSCFTEKDVEAAVIEAMYKCRGCKYNKACGNNDRTEPCDGRRV